MTPYQKMREALELVVEHGMSLDHMHAADGGRDDYHEGEYAVFTRYKDRPHCMIARANTNLPASAAIGRAIAVLLRHGLTLLDERDRLADRVAAAERERQYLAEQVRKWMGSANEWRVAGTFGVIIPSVDALLAEAEAAHLPDGDAGHGLWVVELEEECWIGPTDGDPGRTLVIENARQFETVDQAAEALMEARQYRPFVHAQIVPAPEPVTNHGMDGA